MCDIEWQLKKYTNGWYSCLSKCSPVRSLQNTVDWIVSCSWLKVLPLFTLVMRFWTVFVFVMLYTLNKNRKWKNGGYRPILLYGPMYYQNEIISKLVHYFCHGYAACVMLYVSDETECHIYIFSWFSLFGVGNEQGSSSSKRHY